MMSITFINEQNSHLMVWHDISRYGMFYVHPHKLPGSSRTQEARSGKCMGKCHVLRKITGRNNMKITLE